MMKKEKELLVAVASQKGGVGKSVFTVLLASVLHYRKGLRVAVVDCDYPQHSIALMRERDMEGVMKNDDLKVNLYLISFGNDTDLLSLLPEGGALHIDLVVGAQGFFALFAHGEWKTRCTAFHSP